jgi:L-glyceraldehyde 3-phosphate reductase
MLERSIEKGLVDVLAQNGIGCITFSSLAQGLLTNKYLNGIPGDSRAASSRGNGAIESGAVTPALLQKTRELNDIAQLRNQSLAQMALAWILRDERITSVIIGASKPEQVTDNVACLNNLLFTNEELQKIDNILQ